jgi:hypothetical protein
VTAKTGCQYVIDAHLFSAAPSIGAYFASPSGVTVLLVTRVARIVGGGKGEQFRLYCLRLRRSTLPPDINVIPWPREHRSVGRPRSRAAEAPSPSDKPAIVTKQQRQKLERDRVRLHRRAQQDPANQLVDPIRRANKTAIASQWRDPSDSNVLRKTPKTVSSFRADDPIDRLLASNTIGRGQAWAARRLRIDFERGTLLQKVRLTSAAVAVGASSRGPDRLSISSWRSSVTRPHKRHWDGCSTSSTASASRGLRSAPTRVGTR